MKEVPNKIYIHITEKGEPTVNDWSSVALSQYEGKPVIENVCFVRLDVLLEWAEKKGKDSKSHLINFVYGNLADKLKSL